MIMVRDTPHSYSHPGPFSKVYRFKVTLKEVKPPVWRRIEVPGDYSFWDFHVAITDAFGWWDCHLHEFDIRNPKTGKKERLGIWDEDDPDVKMDWNHRISRYFMKRKNPRAVHKYDFGDGWEHRILLEDIHPPEEGVIYPRCIAGASACPPEDVGGPSRYTEFLEAMRDPGHPEHEDFREWIGGDFDPARFDSGQVRFDDPWKRWRVAFRHEEMTPDMRLWEMHRQQE